MLTDAERKMLQKIKVKSKNKMIRDIDTLKRENGASMMVVARLYKMCNDIAKGHNLTYQRVVELVRDHIK